MPSINSPGRTSCGPRDDDTIALGAWGVEWHDRKTFESTFVYPPDKGTYPIPLRCLVSRDTTNLFAAGRLADADQKAGAALRVMGTAFATGQAAGVAPRWSPSRRARCLCGAGVLHRQGALIDPI